MIKGVVEVVVVGVGVGVGVGVVVGVVNDGVGDKENGGNICIPPFDNNIFTCHQNRKVKLALMPVS